MTIDHGYTQEHVDSGLIVMVDGVPHARVKYLVDEASSCEQYLTSDRRVLWRLKASELDAEFCADVLKQGIRTPVEFFPRDLHEYPDNTELGNGHHRVILAYLLGHELIPVTQSWVESTVDRGPRVTDRIEDRPQPPDFY